jgi:thiol-disulfide isomerase/thioredoxin
MGTQTPPPAFSSRSAPPSRFDGGRPEPRLGPSGRTVLLGIAAAVVLGYFLFRAPSRVAASPLPRLSAEGVATGETVAVERCTGTKGCLIVYVAPWCGPCKQSLPGDRALADFVKDRGIDTTFVVGMDTMPHCSEMARAIGREVLADSSGAWARRMRIDGVPHFLVLGPDGTVRKRQAGALVASPEEVARHLGI